MNSQTAVELFLRKGKLEEAEELLRRATEGREATLGSHHPETQQSKETWMKVRPPIRWEVLSNR